MEKHKACGKVYRASIQEPKWAFKYSAIYMVWCSGYVNRSNLIAFLREAQKHLIKPDKRSSRRQLPQSFIFVVENVLPEGDLPNLSKDQWLRTREELEEIFLAADLIVH